MALTKTNVIGIITILEDGQIQLREDTIILDNDIEIMRLYHRRVLEPDVVNNEIDSRLKEITTVVWTKEVIENYKRKKEEKLILGVNKDATNT